MATKATKPKFTFADLFAGIGGMRFAFEDVGGACVLTSEIDQNALITYRAQSWRDWGQASPGHSFVDDVVELGNKKPKDIPDFDVLVAGFPCQPYSIAGLRQGLNDEKGRGQVFLSILDVIKKKKPRAFLLENVRGMLSHDGGKTIEYMMSELAKCGDGYTIAKPLVLNSSEYGGVPQNRERVFIIGFRKGEDISKQLDDEGQLTIEVERGVTPPPLKALLDENEKDERFFYTEKYASCYATIKKEVTKENTAYQWRRIYVRENKSGVCPALTANMGSGGHNVPLVKIGGRIRKLTPKECSRLQGFKDEFVFPEGMALSHLYHQFGNSVTVPVIKRLADQIVKIIAS